MFLNRIKNLCFLVCLVLGNLIAQSQVVVYFCDSATLQGLDTVFTNKNWYDSLNSSTLLPLNSKLQSKLYYFDSNINITTKTPRDSVRVVIVETLDTPSLARVQFFCGQKVIGDIVGFNTNSNLAFFNLPDTALDKAPLPLNTPLQTKTYFATRRSNPNTFKCQSYARVPIKITVSDLPIFSLHPSLQDTLYIVGNPAKNLNVSISNRNDSLKISWYVSRSPGNYNGVLVKFFSKDTFATPFTTPDSFKLYENGYEYYYAVAEINQCATTSNFSGRIQVDYRPFFYIQEPSNDTANMCLNSTYTDAIRYAFKASLKPGIGRITSIDLYQTTDTPTRNGNRLLHVSNVFSFDTFLTYSIPTTNLINGFRYYVVISTSLNQTITSRISGIKYVRKNTAVTIEALKPEFILPDLKYIKIVFGDQIQLKGTVDGPIKAKNYLRRDTIANFKWNYDDQNNSFYDSIYNAQPIYDNTTINLQASNGFGCPGTDALVVWVNKNNSKRNNLFTVPRVLTPDNQDGLFDDFYLTKLQTVNQVSMVSVDIYDKYLCKIYTDTFPPNTYEKYDLKNKDGDFLCSGTYYYVIKINDLNYIQQGSFYVINSNQTKPCATTPCKVNLFK